jgi:hypothetical protein
MRAGGGSMRRFCVTTLVGFAMLAAPNLASATHSASDGGRQDFVTGAGEHVAVLTEGISAHSGPSGEDPRGNVTVTQQGVGLSTHGKVQCLIVAGNRGVLTWIVERGPDLAEGTTVVTEVVDNGNPDGSGPPDLIRNSFAPFVVPVPTRPGCFLPVLAPVPVTKGNYVVHDGQP